jgi:hypothetical protein
MEYGLANHDGLLYHTLRAENHQIVIGPRRYSSVFEQTQYLGRGLRNHAHGIFSGMSINFAPLRTTCSMVNALPARVPSGRRTELVSKRTGAR